MFLHRLSQKNTIVNVISKSGSTTETMVNFFHVFSWFKSVLPKSYNSHFVFTTDPTKGLLNKIARAENIPCFNIPANVGGRFSVLSPVGTLVSQFLGYNIEQLQQGAIDLYSTLFNPIDKNPALNFAVLNFFLYQQHHVNMTVLMPYSSQLSELTNWFKQLWAESIGKAESNSGKKIHIGQTPLSSVGATDQHSLVQLFMEGPQDKLVTFLKVTDFKNNIEIKNPFPSIKEFNIYQNTNLGDLLNIELDATAYALTKNNRFNLTLSVQQVNEYSLGQLFYFFEVSTAFSGLLYDINPFDQPGVEAGKIATKALLGDSSLAALKRDILG